MELSEEPRRQVLAPKNLRATTPTRAGGLGPKISATDGAVTTIQDAIRTSRASVRQRLEDSEDRSLNSAPEGSLTTASRP